MTSKTNRQPSVGHDLSSMSGWQIAQAYGCHYTGDASPIPHRGTFYNLDNWGFDGWAECVYLSENEGILYVSCGSIPYRHNMDRALACIGIDSDGPYATNPHAQFEACKAYWGFEADDTRTFRLSTWREERIWGAIAKWIMELGSKEDTVDHPTVASLADRWNVGITSGRESEFWGCHTNTNWVPFWDSMVDAGLEPTPFFTGEVFTGFRVRKGGV
jgi:hypothetical protein